MEVFNILPTKTVYSFYYPEIQKIISNITKEYPHDVYLKSINPGLDNFHDDCILAYEQHFAEYLSGLNNYSNKYFTAGASEGIFHVLSHILAFYKDSPLYQLSGEYEGYSAYGQNIGLNFINVGEGDFNLLKPGIFFISNPSARNGNYLDQNIINDICEAGHKVVLDITYFGSASPRVIDLVHENILAVIVSLSKPFGLYYYRIGFTFSRISLPTLEANKWFKNILSCIIATQVLTQLRPFELYYKYSKFQNDYIKIINDSFGINSHSSDVFFLAHTDTSKINSEDSKLSIYKRSKYYRFCLTPFFLQKINSQNNNQKLEGAYEEHPSF
jgi:histidinol-phosphate/aromatic aminotransferase/cobyric acid decarboxylase-like protein